MIINSSKSMYWSAKTHLIVKLLKKEISSDDAVDVNKCHDEIEWTLLPHTFASHSELTSHIRNMIKTIFFGLYLFLSFFLSLFSPFDSAMLEK